MDETSPKTLLVSVVVPLFNKAGTVDRTLRSILGQSYLAIEVIVVDDGSTDGGAEVVESLAREERRVRLIRQANQGPGAARNNGAAASRGELITFLDADDEWDPEFVRTGVEVLGKHPSCDAFSCDLRVDDGPNVFESLRDYGFKEGPWRLTPRIGRRELSMCLASFSPPSVIYRRAVVIAYGYYDAERCTFGEDVYFFVRLLVNHSIYRHMSPLAHYHSNDSELRFGKRRGALPLEPVFKHPEAVRASCPTELRDVFELWLARHAIRAAFMHMHDGDSVGAAWLVQNFPYMRRWPLVYAKLRLRMAAPAWWDSGTRLRSTARALLTRRRRSTAGKHRRV